MESLQITGKDAVSITPTLSVRNGKGAIEFYIEALGSQILFRLDGEQDDVIAELSVPTEKPSFFR